MAGRPKGSDSSKHLAEFAARLRFEDVPRHLVELTRCAVLDTIGAALAGAGLGEGCNEIVEFVIAQSGRPEATIWSKGRKVPATAAAFANAALARALDCDDLMEDPLAHVSVCVVPAALAIAECRERSVSGKELVAALVAGSEIQYRLARAASRRQDATVFPVMVATQVFGYFSAAATAGRLLGLPPDKMESAFGLALMQTAGTEEMVVHSPASVGKNIYAAFSVQGGVQSALLAERGVIARGAVMDGAAGLFAAYYGGNYDRALLTRGLGTRFHSAVRCFKFWPGTFVTHPFIEAALRLVAENDIGSDDVAAVHARVGTWGRAMSEPLRERRRPPTMAAAMNNLPFIVAKVFANGTITLDDFNEAGRKQPQALAIADRFSYAYEGKLNNPRGMEGGSLAVRTKDGRECSVAIGLPRGHSAHSLSFEDIAEKFRRNAAHAPAKLGVRQVQQVIECVRRLERLKDVRGLVLGLSNGRMRARTKAA